jgi:predicted nucleotidyltransferase
MTTFIVYIFLCAASTTRGDCDKHSAVDVVLGPEVHNEIMCGLQAQEMFATTAIQPKDGEYLKVSCVRREALAAN